MSRYDPRATLSPFQSLVVQPAMYTALRSVLVSAHALPLPVVLRGARGIGRKFGGSKMNRKRVGLAVDRLGIAMPELVRDERYELVLQSYEHLAMLAVELAVMPRYLTEDAWTDYVELGPLDTVIRPLIEEAPTLLLTGHCGNWETLGYTMALLGFRMHVLYRPLDLRPADAWLRQTRSRRGLELVDKFGAMHKLPELLSAGESVGVVADQNAGDRGLQVPFFGRLASSYKSIGLMAIKNRAKIIVGHARRLPTKPNEETKLKYRIEIDDRIDPEDWESQPDPLFYITARYRRAIEHSVRTAPEQYLWMHRIWKSRPRHERLNKPFPKSLRTKLESLPWMSNDEIEAIVDRSDRDRAYMLEHNITHFK
ncbi:MAG: lysophospholipid acyltransferase family protein [Phycisphaerales bacterium]